MDNAVDTLYHSVISNRKQKLTSSQASKFRFACEKIIAENPDVDFDDWIIGANVYLNLILSNPGLDLGPVITPRDD